jgi:hypothetical protein
MSIPDLETEIIYLENRLSHFEYLLELSVENNELPSRTTPILNEVKKLSEKLDELKKVSMIR